MRQQEILQKLLEGNDLSRQEMETCMNAIMENRFSEAGTGAILALLQKKGVTPAEAIGACESIIAKATPVNLDVQAVDTCGTGGDHTGTFNISTAAAFIASRSTTLTLIACTRSRSVRKLSSAGPTWSSRM